MKISFIVPVYNTPAEKLQRCIASILDVTCVASEVIVINDGSGAELSQAYEAFIQRINYTHIHYIYQENQGVSAARNLGISLASGEYVMMVDSDDTIIPNNFSDRYNADFVLFQHIFVKGRSKKHILRSAIAGEGREVPFDELAWLVTCGKIRGSCGLLYKRDFLLSHDIAYESGCIQGEDADFNFRFMCERPTTQYIKKATYVYWFSTKTARSRWKKMPEKMIASGAARFEQAQACLPDLFPKDYESRKQELIRNRIQDIYWNGIDLCGSGHATAENKSKIAQQMAGIELPAAVDRKTRNKYLDVVYNRWWKIAIISKLRQVYLGICGI